jgi:hypothetical protein
MKTKERADVLKKSTFFISPDHTTKIGIFVIQMTCYKVCKKQELQCSGIFFTLTLTLRCTA